MFRARMSYYIFTIKRTPRGKYYCIVTIGKDVIYVSRKVFDTGEEAHVDAREYVKQGVVWVELLRENKYSEEE